MGEAEVTCFAGYSLFIFWMGKMQLPRLKLYSEEENGLMTGAGMSEQPGPWIHQPTTDPPPGVTPPN